MVRHSISEDEERLQGRDKDSSEDEVGNRERAKQNGVDNDAGWRKNSQKLQSFLCAFWGNAWTHSNPCVPCSRKLQTKSGLASERELKIGLRVE